MKKKSFEPLVTLALPIAFYVVFLSMARRLIELTSVKEIVDNSDRDPSRVVLVGYNCHLSFFEYLMVNMMFILAFLLLVVVVIAILRKFGVILLLKNHYANVVMISLVALAIEQLVFGLTGPHPKLPFIINSFPCF